MSKAQMEKKDIFLDWMIDLLVYIVVLNLFAEYSENVYFETFTITIFTAFVLKILLVLILQFEHKIADFFGKFEGKIYRILSLVCAFLVLFFSKFLILEVINFIFGELVEIRGLIPIILLILTMILVRKILDYIYKKL